MVKVVVYKMHEEIRSVVIQGHADFAPNGQDLVCAGVSSIAVGIMNALDELVHNECTFKMDAGFISIDVRNSHCERAQQILKVMLIQLLTMEGSYSNYIQIQQQEVAS